jgi:hypothetical protein
MASRAQNRPVEKYPIRLDEKLTVSNFSSGHNTSGVKVFSVKNEKILSAFSEIIDKWLRRCA